MNTKELIDHIFKQPGIKFELTEFENLGKPIHDIITIYPKVATTGKDAGKTKPGFPIWPWYSTARTSRRALISGAPT